MKIETGPKVLKPIVDALLDITCRAKVPTNMAGIKIRTMDEQTVTMTACNGDIGLVCCVPVKVAEPGECTVSSDSLKAIHQSIRGDTVSIVSEGIDTYIEIDSDRFSLDKEELDIILPNEEMTESCVLSHAAELITGMAHVTPFCKKVAEDGSNALDYVNIILTETILLLCSTNTYVVAMNKVIVDESKNPFSVCIDPFAYNIMRKVFGQEKSTMSCGKNYLKISAPEADIPYVLFARTFDITNYPKLLQTVPRNMDMGLAVVDRKKLDRCLGTIKASDSVIWESIDNRVEVADAEKGNTASTACKSTGGISMAVCKEDIKKIVTTIKADKIHVKVGKSPGGNYKIMGVSPDEEEPKSMFYMREMEREKR